MWETFIISSTCHNIVSVRFMFSLHYYQPKCYHCTSYIYDYCSTSPVDSVSMFTVLFVGGTEWQISSVPTTGRYLLHLAKQPTDWPASQPAISLTLILVEHYVYTSAHNIMAQLYTIAASIFSLLRKKTKLFKVLYMLNSRVFNHLTTTAKYVVNIIINVWFCIYKYTNMY